MATVFNIVMFFSWVFGIAAAVVIFGKLLIMAGILSVEVVDIPLDENIKPDSRSVSK